MRFPSSIMSERYVLLACLCTGVLVGACNPTGLAESDSDSDETPPTASSPPPEPTLFLDINADSWDSTWNAPGQRISMEYSNAHQHTDGRQLEVSMSMHSRPPGDNTGVRWADFTATGAPTGGYLWPNDDTNITETDNLPTFYMPWKQWVGLVGQKIIDIATPAAIFRNNDSSGAAFTDRVDVFTGPDVSVGMWASNYNPACLVNPGDWEKTVYFGGGYYTNYNGGYAPTMKIIDDNPSYPATSSKPLRLRAFAYGSYSTPFPIYGRHAIRIGDWIYWGGAGVSDTLARFNEFYRIYGPDLELPTPVVTQETLPTAPVDLAMVNSVRFSLLAGDITRKHLIYINAEGAFRYRIPADDGNDGVWEGPYSFGVDWDSVTSDGAYDAYTGAWHGFIGTHRSDLNQTFFRYNLSKKWHRITWPE
jgi:hypothetical protein